MTNAMHGGARILVVENVEETRDVIEGLLHADGYRVDAVRDEVGAVRTARRNAPDLILVSPGGAADAVVALVARIRRRARLSSDVPAVVFCVESIAEGAEVELGPNVYGARPDSFDQLRALFRRLLRHDPRVS